MLSIFIYLLFGKINQLSWKKITLQSASSQSAGCITGNGNTVPHRDHRVWFRFRSARDFCPLCRNVWKCSRWWRGNNRTFLLTHEPINGRPCLLVSALRIAETESHRRVAEYLSDYPRSRMIDWSRSSWWRKTPCPHDSGESTSTNTTRINSWTTRTRRPNSRDRTRLRWTISSDNILQFTATINDA